MTDRDRILVIDDSTTLRKLVEIAFRSTTTEVDFAASGAEGIQCAIAEPPDAILLDFLLPDMRGVDVCARLAENHGTASVPVVVMSAKHEGVKDAFSMFPRVVDFVAKPFSMDEIRARLTTAMRGRTPPRPPAMIATGSVQPIAGQGEPGVATTAVAFSGDLAVMPLLDALRFISMLQLTGCLTLELATRLEIYARNGDVVLCTSYSPPSPADLDHVPLAHTPRAAIDQAVEEQIRTGKPALASLAEAGFVQREVAPLALAAQSARFLGSALDAKTGALAWRTLDALPAFVAAFGRPQTVTGIMLGRRRDGLPDEAAPDGFLAAIYERTPRFSRKLAGARLSASERKLLALFDGETPVSTLLERTGIPPAKAASVCNRLCAVDLIELRAHARTGAAAGIALWSAGASLAAPSPAGSPDHAEFERSLRALLQRRAPPIEVVNLDLASDLPGTILRARPRLILVSHPAIVQIELIAAAARTSSSVLVAVLDTIARAAIDACLAAGCHAVLTKPVHMNDLERLMSS